MDNNARVEEWIKSRPASVQAVIKMLPPGNCYRSKLHKGGHYRLYSYDEEKDGFITLRIDHLEDSFLPGFRVFGIDPDSLKACGCLLAAQPRKPQ